MFEELANLVFGPIGAVAAVVVFAFDGLTGKPKRANHKKMQHAGVNPEAKQDKMKADMAAEIAAVEKEMEPKMAKVTHINEAKSSAKSASSTKALKAKTSSKAKASKPAKTAKAKTAPKKIAHISKKKSRKAA